MVNFSSLTTLAIAAAVLIMPSAAGADSKLPCVGYPSTAQKDQPSCGTPHPGGAPAKSTSPFTGLPAPWNGIGPDATNSSDGWKLTEGSEPTGGAKGWSFLISWEGEFLRKGYGRREGYPNSHSVISTVKYA